jgi:hypothetical protein
MMWLLFACTCTLFQPFMPIQACKLNPKPYKCVYEKYFDDFTAIWNPVCQSMGGDSPCVFSITEQLLKYNPKSGLYEQVAWKCDNYKWDCSETAVARETIFGIRATWGSGWYILNSACYSGWCGTNGSLLGFQSSDEVEIQ